MSEGWRRENVADGGEYAVTYVCSTCSMFTRVLSLLACVFYNVVLFMRAQ